MIKKIAILCSIFLNLCIVRWEPVAIRMTWEAVGSQTFTFYTENSNVRPCCRCSPSSSTISAPH